MSLLLNLNIHIIPIINSIHIIYLKGGIVMCYENRTKAYAKIKGGNLYPNLHGVVFFDDVEGGTEVSVEVWGYLYINQQRIINNQ
jgi:hypothetical protein